MRQLELAWLDWIQLVAGVLQLAVACYAFRLNRFFGTSRVGWSLFAAFALMTLTHLLKDTDPGNLKPAFAVGSVYLLTPLLLLVGMRHIEELLSGRLGAEQMQQRLEQAVKQKTEELARTNEDLQREMAQRQRDQEVIKESEQQYRLLFTENPQAMWVFDRESLRFLNVNSAAIRQYGYSLAEFRGLTVKDLFAAAEVPALLNEVAQPSPGVQVRGTWHHRTKGQKPIEVEITTTDLIYDGQPARLAMVSDITEHKQLEKQLRQAQKMEAVGQLAGGVAHDFNNVLTVIQGYAKLLLARNGSDGETKEQLAHIAAAGERAANLTRQLLAFSRRQVIQAESVDLNEVIGNLTRMLQRLIGEDIILQHVFAPHLPFVHADRGMLEQILLNLVVNARDAMPDGGKLTITTERVAVDEGHLRRQPEAWLGTFVCLSVHDTGCGISAEIMPHIFEPFFTTKDVNKGTGLGLATVYGIVKQHDGWMEVTSEVGVGTEFKVFLPRDEKPVPPRRQEGAGLPGNGRETILVVEDEDAVRRLVRLVLTRQGYHVLEADCGASALDLWNEHADEIDLLLTDMIMPGGMNGRALAEKLQSQRRGLKVLHTSGYTPTKLNQGALLEGLQFLPKPYDPVKLVRTVRECLDSPA
jgi:two-component system cell cycle sensor histidine kinase/response regulator CckA